MEIADKRTLVMRMAICSQIIACLDEQERALGQGGDGELRDIVRTEKRLFEAQMENAQVMLKQLQH